MRKEDTPAFLSDFLARRSAPLLNAFRNWSHAHALLHASFAPKVDHLSYKCREFREYDELRGRFEEYAEGWSGCRFLHQTIISGRRVAVIGLIDPIPTPLGDLRLLELSEPKTMRAELQGFDHIEIHPTVGTVDDMAEALNTVRHRTLASSRTRSIFVKKSRPHHVTWDAAIVSFLYGTDHILRLTDGPLVEKIGVEMR
ncbi:MAG: VOC family protein [Patescibacteria group bacterium]